MTTPRQRLEAFARGPEGGVITCNIEEVRADVRALLSGHPEPTEDMAGLFFQAAISVRRDATLSEDERDAIAAALAPLWRVKPTADDMAWAEDAARKICSPD